MNTKINFIIFTSLLFTNLLAQAEFTKAKCEHALLGSGEVQVNRQWDVTTGTCFIDIHPRNVVNYKYRDYYFDNHGHFMVFNSYGDGPDTAMTGARDYFLFPIVEDYPDFSVEENGDVVVKMVSGHRFRISGKDFSIVSITPGSFVEKTLSPTNRGGVEINLEAGFWFDGGFKKGASPMANRQGISTINSSISPGRSCILANQDFLNYTNGGDYSFRFQKDQLVDFLKVKCPDLLF